MSITVEPIRTPVGVRVEQPARRWLPLGVIAGAHLMAVGLILGGALTSGLG
jgi:hypothetical protein